MPRLYLSGLMNGAPIRFDLEDGTHVVGRVPECGIYIPDAAISRRHAEILVDHGTVRVKDLQSLNGTTVNGRSLEDEIHISRGDRVKFGQVVLSLEEEGEARTADFGTQDQMSATMTMSVRDIQSRHHRNRTEDMLASLAEAGSMLSRRMEMGEIFNGVLDLLERSLTTSRILILEAKDGEQKTLAARVQDKSEGTPLYMSRTMLKSILEEGKSFLTSDAASDTKWASGGSIVQMGVKAAMGAPLYDNDRILGVLYVDCNRSGITYQEGDLRFLTLLANMVAVKITHSRLEREERTLEALRQELSVAAKIQRNLLPSDIPEVPGYGLFAHQEPCDDIGGDLYDLRRRSDGTVWLVSGDVTGHGIAAALLMSHVMAGLQVLEDRCADPLTLVTELESYLGPRVELGQFVTLFAGILDPASGKLVYVNAGNPPPFILHSGEVQELETTGPPVAVLGEPMKRSTAETTLQPGQSLLIYSDGISESSLDNVQYDEGRMRDFLTGAGVMDAETLGASLLRDTEDFVQGAPAEDDLTLLVIQRMEGRS